jgi:hypothetical protein
MLSLGLSVSSQALRHANSGAASVLDSLQTEANGLAFDFTQPTPQLVIRDTATPANNFNGNFNTKVTSAYASTKRIRNASGVYVAVTEPTPEYNSSGGVLGIPFEGARTNEIRNNSMQGAGAGTPGTLPTNWVVGGATSLTRTIATGTENGIEYTEFRFNGTTGDANGIQIDFEPTTQVVAATGQTWTGAAFVSLASGSITNINTVNINLREGTAAGAFVANNIGTDFKASLTSALQRFTHSPTLAGGGTTARVTPRFNIAYSAAVAVDFTIRIGWPQLEQAAFASSPIRTTSAAVTRSADNATRAVANFPSMSAGGHMVAQWVPGNIDASAFGVALSMTQDGSNHTRISQSTAGKRAINQIAGASAPSLTPTGALAVGTQTTVAYSFAANNYDAASDGGAIQSSASGATLPTYASLNFGQVSSNFQPLYGWLRKGKIVPRTLTDAEVVTLSTLT